MRLVTRRAPKSRARLEASASMWPLALGCVSSLDRAARMVQNAWGGPWKARLELSHVPRCLPWPSAVSLLKALRLSRCAVSAESYRESIARSLA